MRERFSPSQTNSLLFSSTPAPDVPQALRGRPLRPAPASCLPPCPPVRGLCTGSASSRCTPSSRCSVTTATAGCTTRSRASATGTWRSSAGSSPCPAPWPGLKFITPPPPPPSEDTSRNLPPGRLPVPAEAVPPAHAAGPAALGTSGSSTSSSQGTLHLHLAQSSSGLARRSRRRAGPAGPAWRGPGGGSIVAVAD